MQCNDGIEVMTDCVVITFLPSILIPPKFTSRSFDDNGKEVVTKVREGGHCLCRLLQQQN